ncbi:hypothetical protein [Streptomyces sp. NPDC094468]|uniref:hypothetical protein n=1 Tax=Streptomyces sp. NPDC094468 TaxID=3366066 RepID=UPI00382E22C8
MPVPVACEVCLTGRYTPHGPGLYRCRSCGSQVTRDELSVQPDEQVTVHAGVLQVLHVPPGHEVITPSRRSQAAHLGASLALALRANPARPVFAPEDVRTAQELLTDLDADAEGPWVLSAEQLAVLAQAMEVRYALLPSAARAHPDCDAQVRTALARATGAPPRSQRPRRARR